MPSTPVFPSSNFPEDGLRFFHALSNWIEQSRTSKPHLISWKHAQKNLTKLTCIKTKPQKKIEIGKAFPLDTLFVPYFSSGIYVLRQLRHAFCHNGITYDNATKQYRIDLTDRINIAGQFSLESINELVNIFLSPRK